MPHVFHFLPQIITPFKTTGFIDESSPSAIAEKNLNKALGYHNNNKILIMYHSKTLSTTNPLFLKKIKQSLSDLKDYPLKHKIIYPEKKRQISKDKHTAYVVVYIKSNKPISDELFRQFKEAIKTPSNMSLHIGGGVFFYR